MFAAVEMKVRELQLSSNAIWQMIYLRMVFTNPNNPVCGSIVSLLIMQQRWLSLRWLTQGYQQHSTIDCLKLEQCFGEGYAKFILSLHFLKHFPYLSWAWCFLFSLFMVSLSSTQASVHWIQHLYPQCSGIRALGIHP